MLDYPNAEQPGDQSVAMPALSANYAALSPLSFLQRAAEVYPNHIAIRYNEKTTDWQTVYSRSVRLASSLVEHGIQPGDVVAVIAPNIPELFELHYAVPMTGAILNAINTRLEADTVNYILEHGGAKVLFVDRESTEVVKAALANISTPPTLIDINDAAASGEAISDNAYEQWVQNGDESRPWLHAQSDWQSIALNYTSGTTGRPKGVVYHHRGAYLNAMSNITGWEMPHHPTYLWTLPMFHCNGWCFPWTLAAVAGTSVCIRQVNAESIYTGIRQHHVTHFCGAPVVLNMVINHSEEHSTPLPHAVNIMTAAAPPPASVLERIENLGFRVTHVYGLTETYGPAVMCAWHAKWDALPSEERARKKARQGVRYQVLEGLDVLNPDTMEPVPRDGKTLGEVMFKGNIVMRGYYKNAAATEQAFSGGWFHSGDLAVMDPDGYLRLLDRAKDIIISGGENISSIEIEDTLYRHPDVLDAAVAARPDDYWGETPCAFVTLRDGATVTEAEMIAFCRDNMAHFKCPKTVVFTDLPKTSTGKVQKFLLRERAKNL
jgi:fatty-acyl-CoA synthase